MNNMFPVLAGYFTVYPTSNAAPVLGVTGVVIYPANLVIKKLTAHSVKAMLYSLSQKTKAGIGTPFNLGEKSPVLALVFLCPSKIQAGFVRLKSVMVGCIRQLQGWPFPRYGSSNLIQSASQRLEPMRGGLSTNLGETAMRNHAQNPADSCPETIQHSALNPATQVKSFFNLVTVNNRVLFTDLVFSEALALLVCHPHAKIKFSRMEVVQ